jgi:hypothetical protein
MTLGVSLLDVSLWRRLTPGRVLPHDLERASARVEFDRARAGYHQPVLGPYIQVCYSVVGVCV